MGHTRWPTVLRSPFIARLVFIPVGIVAVSAPVALGAAGAPLLVIAGAVIAGTAIAGLCALGGVGWWQRRVGFTSGGHALDLSDEEYRNVIASLHEGICVQNAKGEIIANNPAAERILGLTADQLRGVTSLDPRWRSVHEDGSPFPGDTHPASVTLKTGMPCHGVVMGVHLV